MQPEAFLRVAYVTAARRSQHTKSNLPFFQEIEIQHSDASVMLFYLMAAYGSLKVDAQNDKINKAFRFGKMLVEGKLRPFEQTEIKQLVVSGVPSQTVLETVGRKARAVLLPLHALYERAAVTAIQ